MTKRTTQPIHTVLIDPTDAKRRRFLAQFTAIVGAPALGGCGGSDDVLADQAVQSAGSGPAPGSAPSQSPGSSPSPAPSPAPNPTPSPSPSPTPSPTPSPAPSSPPTTATLSGPAGASVNIPTTFIVALNAPAQQAQTVTPVVTGAQVSPATVTIPAGQSSCGFSVASANAGTYSVDFAINSGLQRVGTPHALAITAGTSYLAQKAALLSAGQCVRLDTGLTSAMLTLDGSNFVQWGISMYRDPIRREVGFIGKRDGPNPYRWAVYSESSNTWDNTRQLWSSASVSGHGYDHNACDPATGDVYHVPFGSRVVRRWNGSWISLPAWPQNTSGLGALTWVPGLGLFYNDGFGLLHWDGSSWTTRHTLRNGSYHDFSEYNDTADVLIFGGGNGSGYFKMARNFAVSQIASPGFTIGANPNTQGIAVSDPNSATLIARSASGTWAAYSISANQWSTLSVSSGSGANPQSGLPPLAVDTNNAPISCAIEDLGVIMFVQHRGSGSTAAEVWLYKHA